MQQRTPTENNYEGAYFGLWALRPLDKCDQSDSSRLFTNGLRVLSPWVSQLTIVTLESENLSSDSVLNLRPAGKTIHTAPLGAIVSVRFTRISPGSGCKLWQVQPDESRIGLLEMDTPSQCDDTVLAVLQTQGNDWLAQQAQAAKRCDDELSRGFFTALSSEARQNNTPYHVAL